MSDTAQLPAGHHSFLTGMALTHWVVCASPFIEHLLRAGHWAQSSSVVRQQHERRSNLTSSLQKKLGLGEVKQCVQNQAARGVGSCLNSEQELTPSPASLYRSK